MPEPKEESENRTKDDRDDEKIARLRDTDEGYQNKTKDDKQPDRIPRPLASADGTKRYNVWV